MKKLLDKKILIFVAGAIALAVSLFALSRTSSPTAKNSIRITWEKNADPDIAGYRVYFGTASHEYNDSEDVGLTDTPETPSARIENLQAGKTYYLAVKAYTQNGKESDFSEEVMKSLP